MALPPDKGCPLPLQLARQAVRPLPLQLARQAACSLAQAPAVAAAWHVVHSDTGLPGSHGPQSFASQAWSTHCARVVRKVVAAVLAAETHACAQQASQLLALTHERTSLQLNAPDGPASAEQVVSG